MALVLISMVMFLPCVVCAQDGILLQLTEEPCHHSHRLERTPQAFIYKGVSAAGCHVFAVNGRMGADTT